MISLEEIKKLALLARIEIGTDEAKELQKDLGAILDYVSKLKEVPVDALTDVGRPTGVKAPKIFNIFRDDEPVNDEPDIKHGEHVRVKHIL
jgi:aspartyl/glutamyl-tRNA(Asn/Gln) amidotransferase C subunit